MGKLENIGALVLLALALCGSDLWLARALAYPADVPGQPVKYKRYVRRRPVPNHPELEIYEVREVYYVRRPTPPTKKIQKLSDFDMELRIRCDFEPTRPWCKELSSPTESEWSKTTPRTTTGRPTPAWKTTSSSTSTSTSTSSSTSTTTDLPMLPLLPDLKEAGSEPDDNYNDEFDDEEDDEDVAIDDPAVDAEIDLFLNPSGSIGGIDTS